jgi:tetratricopeptide (TPR) repeat protein
VPEMARRLRAAAGGGALPEPGSLKRMIHRWEDEGLRTERYELLYARALGISLEELASGPACGPVSSLLPKMGSEGGDDPVRRREFGASAAVSAMSLLDVMHGHSAELPERVAQGSRVDGEAAAGMANVVLGYRQIYQSAGAAALLDPVCGTLRLLAELAPGAGVYRDLIVSLIGQAGSLAATMLMLDQGEYAAALRYLALAARAAQQCGDDELLSITMAARAFHSAYSGDPVDGLAFAREAVSVASGSHPRTRGWVLAVESEMHATVGDEAGYRRSIEAAQGEVTAFMPDRQWKGIGAFSEAKLTAYRGAGLMRLRRYGQAQAVLLDALTRLDPVQAKHRTTAHVDLADAYARDRKPDEAAHHAVSALDIIATTRHAESMKRVAGLYEAIRPTGVAGARELGSRLLAVRAGSVGWPA